MHILILQLSTSKTTQKACIKKKKKELFIDTHKINPIFLNSIKVQYSEVMK